MLRLMPGGRFLELFFGVIHAYYRRPALKWYPTRFCAPHFQQHTFKTVYKTNRYAILARQAV